MGLHHAEASESGTEEALLAGGFGVSHHGFEHLAGEVGVLLGVLDQEGQGGAGFEGGGVGGVGEGGELGVQAAAGGVEVEAGEGVGGSLFPELGGFGGLAGVVEVVGARFEGMGRVAAEPVGDGAVQVGRVGLEDAGDRAGARGREVEVVGQVVAEPAVGDQVGPGGGEFLGEGDGEGVLDVGQPGQCGALVGGERFDSMQPGTRGDVWRGELPASAGVDGQGAVVDVMGEDAGEPGGTSGGTVDQGIEERGVQRGVFELRAQNVAEDGVHLVGRQGRHSNARNAGRCFYPRHVQVGERPGKEALAQLQGLGCGRRGRAVDEQPGRAAVAQSPVQGGDIGGFRRPTARRSGDAHQAVGGRPDHMVRRQFPLDQLEHARAAHAWMGLDERDAGSGQGIDQLAHHSRATDHPGSWRTPERQGGDGGVREAVEQAGDGGRVGRSVGGMRLEQGVEQAGQGLGPRAFGGGFREHPAEGVEAGAGISLADRLLGRPPGWRAAAHGSAVEVGDEGGARGREAEVEQDRLVAVHQDVVGLEVAVHHTAGVQVGEGVGQAGKHSQHFGERPAAPPAVEPWPLVELPSEPCADGVGAVVDEGDDALDVQPGQDADLAGQSGVVGRAVSVGPLQRHHSSIVGDGPVHRPHSAPPERFAETIGAPRAVRGVRVGLGLVHGPMLSNGTRCGPLPCGFSAHPRVPVPPFDVTESDSRSRRAGDPELRPFTLVVAHHPRAELLDLPIVLVPGREAVLGRGATGWPDGLSDDPRQSRAHARVRVTDAEDAVVLTDLDSRNGTRVRGARVDTARLTDGDWFTVGDTVFVVRRRPPGHRPRRHPLLAGISAEHSRLVAEVESVAPTDVTVRISGPPGVGKELVARAIHDASGRTGPFVAVNCGALNDAVLQSELFGHAAGAFTGARGPRTGLVRAAQGGTLLLDEIGEAPPDVQVALLRLLQERTVRPVGADREVPVDVRFLAATNRSPAELHTRLRPDLRSRLDLWPITVPPLVSRLDDLVPTVRSLVPSARLTRSLVETLLRWSWPGNVRELEGIVHRLQVTEDLPWRVPDWLPALLAERGAVEQVPPPEGVPSDSTPVRSSPVVPERPGAEVLQSTLDAHQGNVQATARALGIGRSTLYRWMRELKVRPRRT